MVAEKMTIHHCVSLGPSCHSSEFLRTRGLRRFAAPFDWLHTDATIISACLDDDFESLLSRREMHSVGGRVGHHRRFRTADHKHIFRHHDPAVNDADFARFHRAADRLRRVLEDNTSCTLFFHLETDAPPGEHERRAFMKHSRSIFDDLRRRTNNFAFVAMRAVPRGMRGEACELLHEAHADASLPRGDGTVARLLALELPTRTRTVIPFSRLAPQGTPDEIEDVLSVSAALDARFHFDLHEQPPARTARTEAMRVACGPCWVWTHQPPTCGPDACVAASYAELQSALSMLPVAESTAGLVAAESAMAAATAWPPRRRSKEEGDKENEGRDQGDVREEKVLHGSIDLSTWADLWVRAVGEESVRVTAWRAAAKRLATPTRRATTRTALVREVLCYQVTELRAMASGASDSPGATQGSSFVL